MGYRVVCISSEDGAGAGDTARLVADALSFRLIDEEIVARAAAEAGVDATTTKANENESPTKRKARRIGRRS